MPVLQSAFSVGRWLFVMCCILSLLYSCTKKPDPVPSWSFEAKGIQIRYTADRLLNAYNNKPHTLLLIVYQLDNINAFNKFSTYKEGLGKLLEAKTFDPGVMAVQRVYIEPGAENVLVMNRADNAKWVGIVAGYYDLEPGKVNKSFEIPFKVETKGFIRKEKIAKVQPLNVNLLLGPHSIQEIKKK